MQPHRPLLVVISGPAGSGKTTLAHELARALRCPAICRDEIKEGMAFGRTFDPGPADALLAAIDDGRYFAAFQRLAIDAPSIDVDTTAGYEPALDEVVAFIEAG